MLFELLPTKNLLLRKIDQTVLDHVFATYADAELMSFLNINSSDLLQVEREKYNSGLSTFKTTFLYFQMMDPLTMQLIGSCGFHTWYLQHNRAEIGYSSFEEQYKGKG